MHGCFLYLAAKADTALDIIDISSPEQMFVRTGEVDIVCMKSGRDIDVAVHLTTDHA